MVAREGSITGAVHIVGFPKSCSIACLDPVTETWRFVFLQMHLQGQASLAKFV
jgi:hypothetical protein